MDEKQLEALARKNAAKAAAQRKPKAKYDSTLPADDEAAEEAKKLFKEMKRREF
ncbi:MAG TPA: hypothetical protein VMT93_08635 [Gemmatimonadaceae bacterium]|nr:hypothetical protein [Gemmatimonadaceae bacterium]